MSARRGTPTEGGGVAGEAVEPARAGVVWLVGAGPGDPGLLTRRGWELLRGADAVVHDRLVSPALLALCPAGAERYDVGKWPGRRTVSQEEINALLVRLARAGKRVVRLKGGDPFVFGRGGEEALALAAAGVAWEVVPGVSAAIAAAGCAGIPLTHRGVSQSVVVLSGHEGLVGSGVATADTLVVLMGVARLAAIVERLLALGRDPEEPAAVIEQASTPGQRTVRAPLRAIAAVARDAAVAAPATLVVGRTVALGERLNQVEHRPLHGRGVLVARTRVQPSQLAAAFRALGAAVLELPRLDPRPAEPASLARALRGLAAGEVAWVVLASPTVVGIVWGHLRALGLDSRAVRAAVAACGPGTVAALRERGIEPDWAEAGADGGAVARGLAARGVAGQAVLVPCLDQGGPLAAELRARGAVVRELPVACLDDTAARAADAARLRALLAAGALDACVFPASRSVERLAALLGADRARLNASAVVCMGPATAAAARRLGLRVDAVAATATRAALVDAVSQVLAGRPRAHRPPWPGDEEQGWEAW